VLTSAPQIRRLFEVARTYGRTEQLGAGLRRTTIAAIGPAVAAALERHGLTAAIMPNGTYFMKPLVLAITAALKA